MVKRLVMAVVVGVGVMHGAAAAQPGIRVESVRKVFDDGNHNAFTDLCRFRGEMYLAFRSCPQGHMQFDTSRIVVMRSRDGREWKEVYTFRAPSRDVRDPHFLVFKDTLFIYSGTWLCDPNRPGKFELKDHLGYAVWTKDGAKWEGPRAMEGTAGYYVWRAAEYGGKAYLCGRRNRSATETERKAIVAAMLESTDGLSWKEEVRFQEENGNETAFLFEKDGEVVALARAGAESELVRARPPYREWTRTGLGRSVGGPMLVKWEGQYLVGGRKTVEKKPKTVLSWLSEGKLVDVVELPSGGDNSYTGFVDLGGGRGLVSYYSSHEGSGRNVAPCSIYLAEIRKDF